MPSTASTNCHMISGRSGLPKFRQLVAPIGMRAGAGDVARRLGDREHRAAPRIEVAVAAVAVDRHRQRARRALDADDAGAHAGEHDRVGPHHVVVLPVDPALAGDGRRREQRIEARPAPAPAGSVAGSKRCDLVEVRRPRRRPVVDRRLVDERGVRNLGDDRAVILDPQQAVVGDVADVRGVEVPLLEDRLDLAPRAPS